MEEVMVVRKRVRDGSESPEPDSDPPEVKRLKENLLDSLDDDPEICTQNQDLDSFIKSFEEEIISSPSVAADGGGSADAEVGAVDLASYSGESRPDLGYLLEASDDELGIPPPTANEWRNELVRVESDSSEFGVQFWEMPGYDAFESGFEEADNVNGGYVTLDGLFDYPDLGNGSGEYPWRPETLPAQ